VPSYSVEYPAAKNDPSHSAHIARAENDADCA
jgi:hypothetical protein